MALGSYDHSKPLVIDPVLSYSTYLGGSDADSGAGIAVDGQGNAYLTGQTESPDFPSTPGVYQPGLKGTPGLDDDAFVAKLNPTGTGRVYVTYLGGSYGDGGTGIVIDGQGNVYLTGQTASPDFPTPGGYQTTLRGLYSAFVAELNASGSALLYATYLGGTGDDNGAAIALDGQGNVYVTGRASANFPTTPGAFQPRSNGAAFVSKLDPARTGAASLVYSTYLGGTTSDAGGGIAVDGQGDAYVVGTTISTDFPTTPGSFQMRMQKAYPDTYWSAFVAKLNAGGTGLVYSTYLEGSRNDYGYGIAVDQSGDAYVTGSTSSPDFPTTYGALRTEINGSGTFTGTFDAFVAELNASGSALSSSTFLGGSSDEAGVSIAVDSSGSIYVTGETSSTDFPITPGAVQTTLNGGQSSGFVAELDAALTSVVYATYLGSGTFVSGAHIALDAQRNLYVTGNAGTGGFPVTAGAFQTSPQGNGDAFVAKLAIPSPTLPTCPTTLPPGIATPGGLAPTPSGQTQQMESATTEVLGSYNGMFVAYRNRVPGAARFDGTYPPKPEGAKTDLTCLYPNASGTPVDSGLRIVSVNPTGTITGTPTPVQELVVSDLDLAWVVQNGTIIDNPQLTPDPTITGTPQWTPIPIGTQFNGFYDSIIGPTITRTPGARVPVQLIMHGAHANFILNNCDFATSTVAPTSTPVPPGSATPTNTPVHDPAPNCPTSLKQDLATPVYVYNAAGYVPSTPVNMVDALATQVAASIPCNPTDPNWIKVKKLYAALASVMTPTPVPTETLSIPIPAGWSMISLPLAPSFCLDATTVVTQLLAQTGGSTAAIYGMANASWSPAETDSNGGLSGSDFNLQLGQGYLFYSDKAGSIPVTGVAVTASVSVPLASGWNAVGFPDAAHNPDDSYTFLRTLLGQTGGSLDSMDALTGGSWTPTATDNKGAMSGTDFPLQAGVGYLLYTDTGTTGTFLAVHGGHGILATPTAPVPSPPALPTLTTGTP